MALVRMQHFITAQHRLHRQQRQNHQCSHPKLRIGEGSPRQHSQHSVTDQRNGQATHVIPRSLAKPARDFGSGLRLRACPPTRLKSWCTGKDSNLRTSLGGTDLQSVGFNHSPTCAKTLGRCGRHAPSGRPLMQVLKKAPTQNPQTRRSTSPILQFRKT